MSELTVVAEGQLLKEQQKLPRLERDRGVVTIIKPEGTYTIIYSKWHGSRGEPKKLPSTFDGLVLETGTLDWIADPLGSIDRLTSIPDYANVSQELEANNIPIILADIANANFITEVLLAYSSWMPVVMESYIGNKLLERAKDELIKVHTRRNLLKAGVETVLAGWLIMPVISTLGRGFSVLTDKADRETAELRKKTLKLHPELFWFLEGFRNAVIAHKEQYIMTHDKHYKHLVTIIGGQHTSLEDQILATPEERMQFLRVFQPILQRTYSHGFYSAAEMHYTGTAWQLNRLFEVPELKELYLD